MNEVIMIGRLTKDPTERHSSTGTKICDFTIAIDRPVAPGAEKKTDFPRITAFGKQAENCLRFLKKGSQVGIHGSFRTDNYVDKETGKTVYSAGVTADRVEFLTYSNQDGKAAEKAQPAPAAASASAPAPARATEVAPPEGFMSGMEYADEDFPF